MSKYTVHMTYDYHANYNVEASSVEEAIEKAQAMDDPDDDWTKNDQIFVYDENGYGSMVNSFSRVSYYNL